MPERFLQLLLLVLSLLTTACTPLTGVSPLLAQSSPKEIPIQTIPLKGLVSLPNAELSGLAWFGDWLILLPQYPSRFPGWSAGALLAVHRQEILDFIEGRITSPLSPRSVPLLAPNLTDLIGGYEGFEAVAIQGNQIFLTVEAKKQEGMVSYLLSGNIATDLSSITLNTGFMRSIPAQAQIANFSDEAIVLGKDFLLTLYESNGAGFNPAPIAHQFDLNLLSPATFPFPSIEYRITDATPLDSSGHFWVINYFYPGDTKIAPTSDPLAVRFGKGQTHSAYPQVERLVQLHLENGSIHLTDTQPLQLQLVNPSTARNWEGLAILEGHGFLLVTDQYPETILAFVPYSFK